MIFGPELLPAEAMALTVARAMTERGEAPGPNIASLLVATIDRLVGNSDWSAE